MSENENNRPFPVVNGATIPWWLAIEAYAVYSERYGTSQSLARLAERGGFHVEELDEYVPGWRDRISEVARLRAQRDSLQRFKTFVHERLTEYGVPEDPDPVLRARTGCRVGCRLQWLRHNRKGGDE